MQHGILPAVCNGRKRRVNNPLQVDNLHHSRPLLRVFRAAEAKVSRLMPYS